MVVFTFRNQAADASTQLGTTTAASLLVALGLGCPSYGTSLLIPIISLVAASPAQAIAQTISVWLMPVGLAVGCWALYSAGAKSARIIALQTA